MPRGVERVGAVEHAEVVGLAPDDLLLAKSEAHGDAGELQVGVGLAQLILEFERVAGTVRKIAQVAIGVAPRFTAERRLIVVDTVVGAAVEQEELRALDEG